MMDELAFLPATAAADLVRRKLISARELAELVLARIDALNPALNAVVEVTVEACSDTPPLRTRQWRADATWDRGTASP